MMDRVPPGRLHTLSRSDGPRGSRSGSSGRASAECPRLCLRLLQIELHVHLAIHRRRDAEVLVTLLTLAHAPEERAEAEVAVGDERAHAARLGERQSLAVMTLRRPEVGRILARAKLGKQVESAGLLRSMAETPRVVER